MVLLSHNNTLKMIQASASLKKTELRMGPGTTTTDKFKANE